MPAELARAVRTKVGTRELSSFVTRAVRHELEREALGAFLSELDDKLGPPPQETLAEARAAWSKR